VAATEPVEGSLLLELQSETDKDGATPQDKNERAGKFQASAPICRTAPPTAPPRFALKIIFAFKIIYFVYSEANVPKFIWRKIALVKLVKAAA
jgi:hypothetical protein